METFRTLLGSVRSLGTRRRSAHGIAAARSRAVLAGSNIDLQPERSFLMAIRAGLAITPHTPHSDVECAQNNTDLLDASVVTNNPVTMRIAVTLAALGLFGGASAQFGNFFGGGFHFGGQQQQETPPSQPPKREHPGWNVYQEGKSSAATSG